MGLSRPVRRTQDLVNVRWRLNRLVFIQLGQIKPTKEKSPLLCPLLTRKQANHASPTCRCNPP
jgi:hypothetical protein